jgi:hypothetical protein
MSFLHPPEQAEAEASEPESEDTSTSILSERENLDVLMGR